MAFAGSAVPTGRAEAAYKVAYAPVSELKKMHSVLVTALAGLGGIKKAHVDMYAFEITLDKVGFIYACYNKPGVVNIMPGTLEKYIHDGYKVWAFHRELNVEPADGNTMILVKVFKAAATAQPPQLGTKDNPIVIERPFVDVTLPQSADRPRHANAWGSK